MTTTSRTVPTRVRAAGAVAALGLAAGCSSATAARPADTASSRPTSTARPASPSPSTPAQQALAAYRAVWADVQQVSASIDEPGATTPATPTPNYQNPILAQHLTGTPLLTIQENLDVNESQGIIALGAPVLHPTVLSATATTVQLTDCIDGTHWLQYYASTKQPVNDVPGGFRYTTATITNQHGTWMVTQLNSESDGTCHVPG